MQRASRCVGACGCNAICIFHSGNALLPLQYTFLRAYGATESLPPEDADVIVDNAATGSTLKANNLEVFDSLMNSTTRMFASKAAWENPAKRARIEKLVLLLQSVMNARKRLMLTFNCPGDKLEHMLKTIPAYVSAVLITTGLCVC
jgi:ATP phosphoribosyltransferase